MALFVPTWHAENIYKIDVNFYKNNKRVAVVNAKCEVRNAK